MSGPEKSGGRGHRGAAGLLPGEDPALLTAPDRVDIPPHHRTHTIARTATVARPHIFEPHISEPRVIAPHVTEGAPQ